MTNKPCGEIQEYEDNDSLTCPYCGFDFIDWWIEWPSNSAPDDDTEIKCETCENYFIATYHYTPTFDAKKKKKDARA